jgi:RNA polymerase-binding transcription factor
MQDGDYRELHAKLLAEGGELNTQLRLLQNTLRNVGAKPVDPSEFGEAAGDELESVTVTGQINQIDETLYRIAAALRSMENGTYGRCEKCGEEIPLARLQALPFAKHCLGCQELVEGSPQYRLNRFVPA